MSSLSFEIFLLLTCIQRLCNGGDLGSRACFCSICCFGNNFSPLKRERYFAEKIGIGFYFILFSLLSFPWMNVSNRYLIVCMYAQVAEVALSDTPFPPQQHRKCSIHQDFSLLWVHKPWDGFCWRNHDNPPTWVLYSSRTIHLVKLHNMVDPGPHWEDCILSLKQLWWIF